jgi:hypothetical protein
MNLKSTRKASAGRVWQTKQQNHPTQTTNQKIRLMAQVTEGQLREVIAIKAHRDPNFSKELLSNPKKKMEEMMGSSLPSNLSVSVVEDTGNRIHIVIPPLSSDELSEEQLEAVSGGFLDATLGSSVLGDGMLCIGGGLINSKMELNL